MNTIVNLIVAKLLEKLAPQIAEMLAGLGKQLLEKIVALLPVIVAAGTKALGEQLRAALPGLPLVSAVALPDLVEKIRSDASDVLPDDVDIPIISDLGERLLGFDLTDLLTGRK
jgi:hypothetical protein